MVIIVDCDSVRKDVIHAKVLGAVFDVKKFFVAFVGGHEFGFAGALVGLVFLDGAPAGDGTATATDEVAGERSIPEEFESGTVGDGVAELVTPVCIIESGKLMDLGRQGRSSVGVCLFVVMMRKVVE